MRALSLFMTILLLSTARSGTALELGEQLQLHGFASQAIIQSSANRYFGDSEDGSLDLTEIGLNLSYRLNARMLLAAQVLARRAGDMYDGSPVLDYGLLDMQLLSSPDYRLGVRLGRIKNPFGLYNETRDVPFTRPSIFLPQVVYFDKVRNLVMSSDGMMLYGSLFGRYGTLDVTLGAGQMNLDDNVEWTWLGLDGEGEFEAREPSWIAGLWYSSPDESLRLGVSGVMSSMDYVVPGASVLPKDGWVDFSYLIASLQYSLDDWILAAEYARVPMQWNDLWPLSFFSDQVTEGYYLQGIYRLRTNLEWMLRYEEGFASRHDRDGEQWAAQTGGLSPPHNFYSKIWTTGLGWQPRPNLLLRLEYQRHQGTFALSLLENPPGSGLVRDWDVWAASVSIRF